MNFAIGDCINEIERLFGKERTVKFTKEFLRLDSLRDYVLSIAGGTLIYLQQVEEFIQFCCAPLELKGIRLTVADFLSGDPERRRVTLGQMKSALVKANLFSTDFETQLASFVEDRNRFVHRLWVEEIHANPFTGLPNEDQMVRIAEFLRNLTRRAYTVERVFKGLCGTITESHAETYKQELKNASFVNPWHKYIPEFEKASRRN